MPRGFYPDNQNKPEWVKNKISLSKKGKHGSVKTEFKKGSFIPHKSGCNCWRCNRKIYDNVNLGRKHTNETKKKWSELKKGKIPKNILMGYGFGKGIKNPNWNNGSSFEPYGLEFNEDLKEVIRNRDRRKCQICGKTELENRKKLPIHHIDYNKKNNDPKNLISVCKSCHGKTNRNRDYWIKYFARRTRVDNFIA